MNKKAEGIQDPTPEVVQDTQLQQEPSIDPSPTRTEIELRVYGIYVESGSDHGHDHDDWLQAECELRAATDNKKQGCGVSCLR